MGGRGAALERAAAAEEQEGAVGSAGERICRRKRKRMTGSHRGSARGADRGEGGQSAGAAAGEGGRGRRRRAGDSVGAAARYSWAAGRQRPAWASAVAAPPRPPRRTSSPRRGPRRTRRRSDLDRRMKTAHRKEKGGGEGRKACCEGSGWSH